VGAAEDGPLVDGEVVASPRVGSPLVEEGECHVDFAQGLDIIDVLNEVVTEGLVTLLASVISVRQVDLIADVCIGLCGGLLCSRLASCSWYRGRSGVGWDSVCIKAGDACYSQYSSNDHIDVVDCFLASGVEGQIEHVLEICLGEVEHHDRFWFLILRVFLLQFFLFWVFGLFFGLLFLLISLLVQVFNPLLGLLRFWF